MRLRKLYVAVLAVAIGSTATVSAVAFQQQAVPSSAGVKSCPTSTVAKNTNAPSDAVEKAVSQALASAQKSKSCPQTSAAAAKAAAAAKTAAAKASSGSSNCSNTAVKAQTAGTCPTSSAIPDLTAVLNQVSSKRAEAAKAANSGSTVNVPDCFRQLLERCGISVPDSLTSQKNCGNSGSSSSSKPSSSKPSTSSQPASSQPASSAPASSKPSSSTPSSSQPSSSAASSAKPSDTLTYEERVVELVNQERAKVGLKPLTMNLKLSDVARAKSQDMHDKNYFSHTSPTYGSPFDMMKQFGITYRTAGENIAMGYRTPEAVMEGWMNSPGHKANILNSSYTEIGVGYVSDGSYWTQEFIG